jgi:hypothetical protein
LSNVPNITKPVPDAALLGAVLEHLDALLWRLSVAPAPALAEITTEVRRVADLAGGGDNASASFPVNHARAERAVARSGILASGAGVVCEADVLAYVNANGVHASTVAFRASERPLSDICFEALRDHGRVVAHGVVRLVGRVAAGAINTHAEVELLDDDEIAF